MAAETEAGGDPLYDMATKRFDVPRLRRELFLRGLTTSQLVRECRAGETTIFRALRGSSVSHQVAIAIGDVLDANPRKASATALVS